MSVFFSRGMDLRLVGKVAWVTGGGGGIGSAIAAALSSEGADVAITGRTLSTLEETAAGITVSDGGRVIAVPADVTDSGAVVEAAATIAGELGGVDILVNSAATPGGKTGTSFETLGPLGITSNVVHPGATRGRWLSESLAARSAAGGASEAELEAELASVSAIRRLLDPEEIAHVVAFLASPLSAAVTGESIGTGGAWTAP
jgi:NAD(P)-dependent dehydrogenase (short-subunit alcohol dehydrogenase family)